MRKIIHILYGCLGLMLCSVSVKAQDFLLEGCYWDCPESSSIEIDEASLNFWTAKIKSQAPELGHNGFSYIWLPPATTANTDILGLIDNLSQVGIQTISDLNINHENTDSTAISSTDHIPEWLNQASSLGVNSFQINQNKYLSPNQVAALLNGLHEKDQIPQLFITKPSTEPSPTEEANWLSDVINTMREETARLINPRVHDKMLRDALRLACNDPEYDVRNVFEYSLRDATSLSGFNVITYVNSPNHRNQNGTIGDADDWIDAPLLAYAYTLTNNQVGLPSVFYADYFGSESEADLYLDKAPLKDAIDQLMRTHQQYIYNSTNIEYLNALASDKASIYLSEAQGAGPGSTLVYQLDGSNTPAGLANKGHKDVIVAINFAQDTLQLVQEINASNIGEHDYFSDILGLSNNPKTEITFDSTHEINNAIYIELPPRAYSIWVQGNEKPVIAEFISFEVEAYDDFVELNWEIPSEKTIQGYEVQRSSNGGSFEQIGWLDADHFTEIGASYLFIDKDFNPISDLYYRIKLIDAEGNIEYSQTEQIPLRKQVLNFEITEGPNANTRTIEVTSNAEDIAQVDLFDAEGKRVMHESYTIHKGITTKQLDLKALPKGVYILNYSTRNKKSWTERLVKL